MVDKYLVINAGSSSVKFSLYADNMDDSLVIARGNVERIGKNTCNWLIKSGDIRIKGSSFLKSHVEAVKVILKELINNHIIDDVSEIKAVGHRVLHGTVKYADSTLIDESVIRDIKDATPLAPLHHPGELDGINCIRQLLPNAINVASFDTAFHQTIPEINYMYAVPYEWYTKYGVRRYGFHGTSHKYITQYMQKVLKRNDVNLIICHIGNGASITAVLNGKSYDTSMGLTPLDGLMMGTRSGGIDPSILAYVQKNTNESLEQLTKDLNEKSGLEGICGKSDYRDIERLASEGDEKAKLALKMYVKNIANYIVIYNNELRGKVDGIVFTAGVGENSANFHKMVIDEIKDTLGINLDEEANNTIAAYKEITSGVISGSSSKIPVYVIPTDEEKMIYLDTKHIYESVKEKDDMHIKHL